MSLISVPNDFSTIQEAIDSAQSSDEIMISSGFYSENLLINDKNNISLIGIDANVVLTGANMGGTAIKAVGNYLTIKNLVFANYTSGLSFLGNSNKLSFCTIIDIKRVGIALNGKDNSLNNLRIERIGRNGVEFAGSNNCISNSSLVDCGGSGISNITPEATATSINSNTFSNCKQGISLMNNSSTGLKLSDNIIDSCEYGVFSKSNKVYLKANAITNCTNAGAFLIGNDLKLTSNTFIDNPLGIVMQANDSEVLKNIVEKGEDNGITAIGNSNVFMQNSIIGYEQVGLLMNGCHNLARDNVFKCNSIDSMESAPKKETSSKEETS